MGRTSLVYYAAALALSLPTSPSLAAKAVVLHGDDILRACGTSQTISYCAGYINALHDMEGYRYVSRACPPPIVENGSNYPRTEVLEYMLAHPETKSQNAIDVVFEAETESMSRYFKRDCSKK